MIERTFHGEAASDRAGRPTRGVFLGLRRCGLSVQQAGNLTAYLQGIHAVPGGWTVEDIERLRFVRWLIASGRIGADDMHPSSEAGWPPQPDDGLRWAWGSRLVTGSPRTGRDRQPASTR